MNRKPDAYGISLFGQLWGRAFATAILGIVIVAVVISDSRELPVTIIGAVLCVVMTVFAAFEKGDGPILPTSSATPMVIRFYRKKGRCVVEACQDDYRSFSQVLKNSFGGFFRYGTPVGNHCVIGGCPLRRLPVDDRVRTSVMRWIYKLIKNI